jgi:hypothetical protein
MSKRIRSPGSHSPSLNPEKTKDAPRKRARMAGSNGKSFAQRMKEGMKKGMNESEDERSNESMNKRVNDSMDKIEIFTISGSSDDDVPGRVRQRKHDSPSDVSSLRSLPIGQSGTNNSSPLGHKSAEMNLEAKNLTEEYDPGSPDFESEPEFEQTTGSHSGEETREGGSFAMQYLRAAKKSLKRELKEVTERMNQDRIQERELTEDLIGIRQSMKAVEDTGL